VSHRIALSELYDGRTITVYGQQEVVKDLIAGRVVSGAPLHFDATVTAWRDISWIADGQLHIQ